MNHFLLRTRPHYAGEIWNQSLFSQNAPNFFRPHYAGEIWKRSNHRRQKSSTAASLAWVYHVTIMTSSFFFNVSRSFQNAKPAFSNSSGFKSVFEKLRFRDGLVWTVGQTVNLLSSINSSSNRYDRLTLVWGMTWFGNLMNNKEYAVAGDVCLSVN